MQAAAQRGNSHELDGHGTENSHVLSAGAVTTKCDADHKKRMVDPVVTETVSHLSL
jgi:hypothetical protein